METQISIIDAINSKHLFRPLFKDLDTWFSWQVFLKSLYGLKLNKMEKEVYQFCTGRQKPSKRKFKEAYVIAGRGSGKSYIASLTAIYTALFSGLENLLNPGETGYIFIIATDKKQARICLDYIKAFLSFFPDVLDGEPLAWEVRLKNKISIEIRPANYRASRGATTLAIIADELAFWRDEHTANPAGEVINSLLPRLLDDGLLFGLSTPYAKFGFLYEQYKKNYGDDESDILIWKAATELMNPEFSKKRIERLIKRDQIKFKAEFYAEFRSDVELFLSEELIDLAMKDSVFELPKRGVIYKAFVDPSGGRGDSMTLGIAYADDGVVNVIRVKEYMPEFEPDEVVKDFCEIIKQYNCWEITGDNYAAAWVASKFKKNGIVYKKSSLNKSEIYLNGQVLFTTGKLRLPKNKRLKEQLQTLERKPRSGGKDSVDHMQGAHDDLANAACGAAVLIQQNIFNTASTEELLARRPIVSGRSNFRTRRKLTAAEILEQQEIRDVIFESRKDFEKEQLKKKRLAEMRAV